MICVVLFNMENLRAMNSSARSSRILQMCLNSGTESIKLPEKNNILPEGFPACSSTIQDTQILSIPLKIHSENNSVKSCLFSSDSDDDPTYLPDSDYDCDENETMECRTENYAFRAAVGSHPSSSFKNRMCNVDLSHHESSEDFYIPECKKIVIISNKIIKNSDTPEHSQIAEQNILQPVSLLVSDETNADGDENIISSTTNEHVELVNEAGISKTQKNSRTTIYKSIRNPDFCFFCETEVKNFARHIQRNHGGETEVQNILALPPKSIERKRAIACLRKKGNFIQNSTTFSKPVHKSLLKDSEENYIPCPICLGFYSRKLLWKHKKICSLNENPPSGKSSAGQNLVLRVDQTNLDLKTKVFPRMIADKVSLIARKDSLICAFGSRYLNTHREFHQINVCSRKMRELAKVLMESEKLNSSIKNLFDLLQPQYFDLVVQSVKIIAKYDPQKEEFKPPTFAMNISRSLKDCCDIAILHIIKRKHNYLNLTASEAEAHVGLFKKLLETTWKHEISTKAGNDLNTKTWNKITLVPLAADLKLFRDYLIEKGTKAAQNLKQNIKNFKAFKILMETIFCRLLLLNRRRVGELQRIKLATYMYTEKSNNKNYEEFADAVTPAEKLLLKNFKRVVTRGKRGRGVPVLFSTDVQDHMKLLLQARSEFVNESNLFLFANPASKEQPLIGYKVIQKHARLCGAVNPEALTSTKLRKHLATLTQVFNMTQNDIEQLATFMGHTIDVHKQVYRLPDDVYQTAKIAKLLMLMERGEAGNYKGKTLDEIDLKMDDDILEEDAENYDMKNNLEITEGIND
ncbi:uncharacterized protein isoform X1 [Leptinotarsa decemlineata]|uniref:uncharacterized protein isoform X1 n=2 Tax=Leptinotarsa decemlineata TaxID=7539 RepID=UPI003D30B3A2